MTKRIVYVDMDDVQCDYKSAHAEALKNNPAQRFPQAGLDFFRKLKPIKGAISGMMQLAEYYDVWILTRPSYKNPLCYMEKRIWVEEHLGIEWCEKLIICPNKALLKGDYLVDDVLWHDFEGTQLLFGSKECKNWIAVLDILIDSKIAELKNPTSIVYGKNAFPFEIRNCPGYEGCVPVNLEHEVCKHCGNIFYYH